MKTLALLISALISGFASLPATAANVSAGHSIKMAAKDTQSHKAKGTVNKINPDGTVNISHGPVDSLGWPGMTMDFQVKNKALLKNLKAGQKIDFEIGMGASGYVIIAISAAK